MRLDKKQAAFGYVFLARKKYSAASAQFDQALETNPDNLEAQMGMATIHEFEGDDAAAFKIYGRLLARAPADAWIKLRYESIQSSATQRFLLEAEKFKNSDKEKYIRALEQAAWFSPDMTAITLQIADHYYEENDWQRCLPFYEAVLEKDDYNETVLLKLAAIYEKTGKFDMALMTLDRLLAIKPGDPFLESEKTRIRDRFQEMKLPEKFKRIFFKTEINREELAALIGFYFEPYISMDRAPEIITDIDGSFAREYIIKTCTSGIMNARPDHTFDRFSTPDRATFAVTLQALITYLEKQGHTLRLAPAPERLTGGRPVAAAQKLRHHHVPDQFPDPDAGRGRQFQPHPARLARQRDLRSEKNPEQHRGIKRHPGRSFQLTPPPLFAREGPLLSSLPFSFRYASLC